MTQGLLNTTSILLLIISILNLNLSPVDSSSSANEKLKGLIKHAKPNYKVQCQDLVKVFKPEEEKRVFLVTSDHKSLVSKHSKSSLIDGYLQQCPAAVAEESGRIELFWRYQFFESAHCIRVEFDLGNLTRFALALDYSYYMFSYRELGSRNIHLGRQPIVDAVNSLTISRAKIKPYIVCVSFYKRDSPILANTTGNASNATIAECKRFRQELRDDQKLQNIDLCIDIDTPTHFLSQHGHNENEESHRELIMVAFIMCLLVFLLACIAACQFVIDRPRKRRMRQVKEYLAKRAHNLFQSTGSHGSLNKDKLLGSNPSMIIVSHVQRDEQRDEPSEGDALLTAYGSSSSMTQQEGESNGSVTALVSSQQLHPKITFSVGETIIEETAEANTDEANEKNEKDKKNENKSSDNEKEQTPASSADETGATNGEANLDGTEEAFKTVSHLLDDKPWSLSRRDSKQFTVEKATLNPSGSQARFNLQ